MLGRLEIKDWPRSRGGCLKENVLEIKKRPCRFSSHSISNQASLQRWQACPSDFSSFLEDYSPQITKEPELVQTIPGQDPAGGQANMRRPNQLQAKASYMVLWNLTEEERAHTALFWALLSWYISPKHIHTLSSRIKISRGPQCRGSGKDGDHRKLQYFFHHCSHCLKLMPYRDQ